MYGYWYDYGHWSLVYGYWYHTMVIGKTIVWKNGSMEAWKKG